MQILAEGTPLWHYLFVAGFFAVSVAALVVGMKSIDRWFPMQPPKPPEKFRPITTRACIFCWDTHTCANNRDWESHEIHCKKPNFCNRWCGDKTCITLIDKSK